MKIQTLKLGDIYPYYNNPRNNQNAVQPVIESFKKFGFIKPIMVDKDHIIICGHTRYIAAFQCGCEYVPVVVSDMPEEQAKRFRILDNKIGEKSSFDEDELIEELKKMEAPEEMQAFFFEDISRMIDFAFNQFENNFNAAGGASNMTDFMYQQEDKSGESTDGDTYQKPSYAPFEEEGDIYEEDEYNTMGGGSENDYEDPAKDLFVVQMRPDATKFMKVVCPYCGNIEEIDIEEE